MKLMALIEYMIVGMVEIILGIMEIILINMAPMEFIVKLGAVEANAAAGLDALGIVINLTRGVSEQMWRSKSTF